MKTAVVLVALFHLCPLHLALADPTPVAADSFTQRDLKVAVLLTTLHGYYISLDRMIAEGARPEDAIKELHSPIQLREEELKKMVGLETLLEQLKKSLSAMEEIGLGPAHPEVLWHKRLIKGLGK